MSMIKEYNPQSQTVVIRLSGYGSEMSSFYKMLYEAQRDFPNITADDVTIIQYGEKHYAKTFGIEFKVGYYAPGEYTRISQLEYIG